MIGARMANMNEVGVELLERLSGFWKALDPPKDWAQLRELDKGSFVIAGTKLKPYITHLRRRNFMTRSESGP